MIDITVKDVEEWQRITKENERQLYEQKTDELMRRIQLKLESTKPGRKSAGIPEYMISSYDKKTIEIVMEKLAEGGFLVYRFKFLFLGLGMFISWEQPVSNNKSERDE